MSVQQIINDGFSNRNSWLEVPPEVKEKVREIIPASQLQIAMQYESDEDKYYFVLGLLHGVATPQSTSTLLAS